MRIIDADKLPRHGRRGGIVYWRDIEALPSAQTESSDVARDIATIIENEMDMRVIAQPERKKGKWIEQTDYVGDTYYDCSACGESWTTIDGTPWDNGMNFCPKCGARMVRGEEDAEAD